MNAIEAPFSEETLNRIRKWQECSAVHPLTCCQESMSVQRDGLHCLKCGRVQKKIPAVVVEDETLSDLLVIEEMFKSLQGKQLGKTENSG